MQLSLHLERLIGFFFSGGGGEGEGEREKAEHGLVAVFKCSSGHAVSLASLPGQKDTLSRLVSH